MAQKKLPIIVSNSGISSALVKPRLRRWEAAQYLARRHGVEIAPSTLAKYACLGGGPKFQKSGRVPLYLIDELDHWAVNRLGPLICSTSDK
ncbi:hypothetical protein DK389_30235 [Methylobacterium durans]|uniref:DNA-binding protein n=1 Tax=Methylobacterium durans TaxID=2202825 RepID=A0A2U8WEL7_9HYPH|nr:hypothetical protein DK389_30235 [Methylobacterium durans]